MSHPQFPTINLCMAAFAFEKLTVTSAAKSLTEAKYAPAGQRIAMRALVTVEGAPIRYRSDGTNPDADTGHFLVPTDTLIVIGPDAIKKIRFFADGGTDGTIMVSYMR